MLRTLIVAGLITAAVVGGLLLTSSEVKAFAPVTSDLGLPAKFEKLGLTDAQKKEITTIKADFFKKRQELMAKLQAEEEEKMLKVLTDEQIKKLKSAGSGSGSSSPSPSGSGSGSASKSSTSESK
jgi:glycerol dehydrogenase-like iron-containing ADH family enzyme